MYDAKAKDRSIRYAKRNLKRIPLDVRREYYDEVILPAAQERGTSVRHLILTALTEKLDRER